MIDDKKRAILAIDDEPSILRSLEGILDDEGYKVFTAMSGPKGLSILTREKVDTVLLDVWMPRMDGIETLQRIKERHPEISVILLTGHGGKETAAKAFRLGASDFLSKPISLDNLLDSIEQVTKRKQQKCVRKTGPPARRSISYKMR
jgi:two-component system, NtrC family, nitrogen regulation response regulator NtrX